MGFFSDQDTEIKHLQKDLEAVEIEVQELKIKQSDITNALGEISKDVHALKNTVDKFSNNATKLAAIALALFASGKIPVEGIVKMLGG